MATTFGSATGLVQQGIGPTLGLCTDAPLYFRGNDFVAWVQAERAWRLARGASVSFDTYFNGLSVLRWKRTAALDDLAALIAFRGRVIVRLHRLQVGPVAVMLDEIELASATTTVARWPVAAWSTFADGVLFLSVHAVDDSVLDGFAFATSTPVRRDVRLGLCITHHDRKAQIVPAIARLKRDLLDDPRHARSIGLVVVDNSRDLTAAETVGATLLPNRNLGGAGGFARGMMHLNDAGTYTHALFMDDDASCEVESIRRTVALLAHARDPRTAISGAMLREAEPYRQFERGARFDGFCHPERSGVDLRDPAVLAWNERELGGDYGGWWFFAFPLAQAIGYPYPTFVRGDDVDFALRNGFPLVHANGIASWQEDFAAKHGPTTQYLDARSHLLHVLNGHRGGRRLALKIVLKLFAMPNLAGQYALAAAVVLAIEDVLRGPSFFAANADLVEPRRRLAPLAAAERMAPMDATLLRDADYPPRDEPRGRRLFRLATLNGHLLPRALFLRRDARFGKGFVLPLRGTFRRHRSFVHDEFAGTGMVLAHSKRRFFANVVAFARVTTALMRAFPRLARAYRAAYPSLTDDASWRERFNLGHAVVAAPPPPTAVAPLARAA